MTLFATTHLSPKPKMTLAIVSVLGSITLSGCSDLSAKNNATASPPSMTTNPQNTDLANASPPIPEAQQSPEERSIWVSVSNTMANMRCH